MNNLVYATLGASLVLLGYITPRTIGRAFVKYREIKNAQEARFCHHCEQAFTDVWEESFKYCPYCGEPLKKIDDISKEEPFDEFRKNS